jgi:hypothetical protein
MFHFDLKRYAEPCSSVPKNNVTFHITLAKTVSKFAITITILFLTKGS